MECYEGAKMIKTFRGLMVAGSQDTIVLHTNDGSTGYRIVKFQVMPGTPMAGGDQQAVLKIYKVSQSSVGTAVDFSDNTLLGAATLQGNSANVYEQTVIFDSEVFNQDIYVTYGEDASGDTMNYYIELEQVKLNLDESTVATLKDIRNKELRTMIA